MQNLVYPLLSFIPALLNLAILVYILFFVPRGKTTDIFCLFILLLLLWQAEDTIVRTCDNPSTALLWVKILCIGWACVAPVAFHFACRYASLRSFYTRFSLVCIYLPFVFFYLLYIGTADLNIFAYRERWNWIVTTRPGTLDGLQRLFISAYVVGAVIILFRYAFKMRNQGRKKLQALLIAGGIFIPTVQGIITQIIFPVVFHKPDIPITSTFLTLFSLATVLSIRKYDLFNISELVDVSTVFTSLKNIVLVVSPSQQIIYMNPYGQGLLAKNATSEEELSLKSIFASVLNYNAFVEGVFAISMKGTPIKDYTTALQTGSGKKIDVLLSAEPIISNKQLQGLLLVANDVTELSQTLRNLEKSNKELEQFAYVASHDLQEPLRKMTTHLQLLETEYKHALDEQAMTYINLAVKSTSEMRSQIQDLLEYASITPGNEDVSSTDMNEVVAKVCKTLALQIEESGAQITCNPLPVLHQVNAGQMQQLFQNLISNALKYRSPNNAYIEINAEDLDEYWRFSVRDNGIGIAPEYREKVFVIFQRLHRKGVYPGTGIGLSICKKIVEQNAGKIWIDSNAEGGCTFFFTISKLPMRQVG